MRKFLFLLMMVIICTSCAKAEATSCGGQKISVSNSPCTLGMFWSEGKGPLHRTVFKELYFSRYPVMVSPMPRK